MRILHVVPSYLPAVRYGGPIVSVHGLCKALARRGHDVHVFTTNVDGPGDSDVPLGIPVDLDGVKVWYFPSRRLRRLYWAPEMGRALEEQMPRFDVLHLHSVFLWPTTAAARVARRHGVPYVLAPRGMLVADLIRRKSRWLKTAWIGLFERANLAHAALVHFTSTVEAQDAARLGLAFGASCVIPNGLDNEALGGEGDCDPVAVAGLNGPERYLLFVGRVNWKKGLDRLIAALPLVPDCRLVIAGNDEEGYRATLDALARDKGVTGRVSFPGPMYGPEKSVLLRGALAFVLPSYSENFGNAALEAMAAGCPVVVTPEVGIADLVRESGAGVVVEGEPVCLGQAIAELISDEERLKEMGRRGRDAVVGHYSWDAVAGRMEEAYRGIVSTVTKGS